MIVTSKTSLNSPFFDFFSSVVSIFRENRVP